MVNILRIKDLTISKRYGIVRKWTLQLNNIFLKTAKKVEKPQKKDMEWITSKP